MIMYDHVMSAIFLLLDNKSDTMAHSYVEFTNQGKYELKDITI